MLEYIDNDIDKLIKNKFKINQSIIKKIIYETLCSLAYMHMLNVIHRDVKPANILVFPDHSSKICDLGLSRSMPRGVDYFLSN